MSIINSYRYAGFVDPVSASANNGVASVGDAGGANPELVNNGNEADTFTTASTPTSGQKIVKIDLGRAIKIEAYRVVNAGQNNAAGLSFRVAYSEDDTSYTIFGTPWSVSPGTSPHTEVEIPASPVTARYWALEANQNADATNNCDEFQLYHDSTNLP